MRFEQTEINRIDGYYGPLEIKRDLCGLWLGVPSYDMVRWQKIPAKLYKALKEFQDNKPSK